MRQLWRYRGWIWGTAISDLRHRYAGSALGMFWNIISPLAMLSVYIFVFTQLMGSRVSTNGGSLVAFPLYLSSGFLPWITFSDALMRSSQAFLTNTVHLKKLAIPEIVFVAQTNVSASVSMLIAIALLLGVALMFGQPPRWSWMLVPLVVLLWQCFAFGLGLVLGTVNVFFRDVGQILPVALQIWMWSLPVVYFEEILPPLYKGALAFNPAYPFLTALRSALFDGVPLTFEWISMIGWAAVACLLGSFVLSRLRTEIRDLL